ncbi:hypothetical protein MAR_030355 [Mya arenaria]|uniref:Uncharacterized protein n=1 Tax=Mya arenaria TaxID=6604 RepID=A0ABY7DLU5_MYAAR|nr:hypothetical protein MAR_030355 [Mya arenaria]
MFGGKFADIVENTEVLVRATQRLMDTVLGPDALNADDDGKKRNEIWCIVLGFLQLIESETKFDRGKKGHKTPSTHNSSVRALVDTKLE